MEPMSHTDDTRTPLPEPDRMRMARALSNIVADLDAMDMTADVLTARLRALADNSGAVPPALEVSPLTALAASVMVAEVADALTGVYARAAHEAGHTWAEIAAASGCASAQSAHWKWGRSDVRDSSVADAVTEARERMNLPDTATLLPSDARAAMPDGRAWRNAAATARVLGCDARTVRAMAERGELEVRERKGPTGRSLNLYRIPA